MESLLRVVVYQSRLYVTYPAVGEVTSDTDLRGAACAWLVNLKDVSEEEVPKRQPRAHYRRLRVSRSLEDLAGRVIRGTGTPTHVFAIPAADDEVTQRHARSVIDLCLRVGEAMLATGASAADVVATVLRISRSYGIMGMHVDITFTSIVVSIHRGMEEDPITVMRVVKLRTTDYTRLQNVYRLIEDIVEVEEPMDVFDAREALNEIMKRRRPYRRWVQVSGTAILAAGVAAMYNVSFILVLVAAGSTLLSQTVSRKMSRWGISEFFTQMAAASLITIIAVFMYWLRSVGIEIPGANHPTVIVISGIIMLLSGIGVTVAARDAIDGYYVTASARGMEVIMLTLGLAIGISLTLGVALRLGLPVTIGTQLGSRIELVPGLIGVTLVGLGFALSSYVRLRQAPLFVLVAVAGFAVHALIIPFVEQPGLAPGIAGTVAGIIGYLAYRKFKIPETAMGMAGIVGLIPGLAVYRALYTFMDSEYAMTDALPALIVALATGMGLAAGTSIGAFIARRAFGLDRAALLASRRTVRK